MVTFGWFMLGVGIALLMVCTIGATKLLVMRYRARRFKSFLDKMREDGEKLVNSAANTLGKEISELTFRDKHGVMNKVRIIIDHDLNDMKIGSKQEMEDMLKSGEAGTLSDLMSGHKVSEDAMGKVQDFVFSPQAVRDMRSSGLEPDEVVTKMLKASGRME